VPPLRAHLRIAQIGVCGLSAHFSHPRKAFSAVQLPLSKPRSANVMAITKWANGFGECDGYHKMGDLRLALLNPTDRSHDGSGRM
jgi:hypothetical protein